MVKSRGKFESIDMTISCPLTIARVCGEDELPIILLQLVEYLGHPNAFVCGVAYNEVRSFSKIYASTKFSSCIQ